MLKVLEYFFNKPVDANLSMLNALVCGETRMVLVFFWFLNLLARFAQSLKDVILYYILE